jgi:hypothetical protein
MGEKKIAVIAAWAQRDSGVPSLNVAGMIEECGAFVKLEVLWGEILEFVRINDCGARGNVPTVPGFPRLTPDFYCYLILFYTSDYCALAIYAC